MNDAEAWTFFFVGGGRGLNLRPCIYYALSPTKLSSRGHGHLMSWE